jgi:hypothetical protein
MQAIRLRRLNRVGCRPAPCLALEYRATLAASGSLKVPQVLSGGVLAFQGFDTPPLPPLPPAPDSGFQPLTHRPTFPSRAW